MTSARTALAVSILTLLVSLVGFGLFQVASGAWVLPEATDGALVV